MVQVDDSLLTGTPSFMRDEELASNVFPIKYREIVKKDTAVEFNGAVCTGMILES